MALPENQEMQAPQLSMMDSYEAMQQGLKNARPDASMELEEAMAEIRPQLDELSDEELALLIQGIEGLYGDPENYAKEVADLVAEDLVDEGDFPAEYDEEFLAAFLMVLIDAQRSRMASSGASQTMPMPDSGLGMAPMGMMPPQGFARGGIAEAARMVANRGRYGDTMLAHITPSEARLLKQRGGSGTINPETGLPEFFLKKLVKAVTKPFKAVAKVVKQTVKNIGKVVKKVLKSPIGRILATIALGMVLGPAVAGFLPGLSAGMAAGVTGALASGTVTALSGGDLKSVLTSAATGFMGAPGGPVGSFVGKYTAALGVTNAAANAALTGAVVGTGSGLISGQSLKDSLKSGLVEGAISGGMAYLSGAPKVEVDDAAATAARNSANAQAATPQAAKFQNIDDAIMNQTLERGKQYVAPDGNIATFVGTNPNTKSPMFEDFATDTRFERNPVNVVSERASAQRAAAASPTPSTITGGLAEQGKPGIMGTPEAQAAIQNFGTKAAQQTDDAIAAQFNRVNYDPSGNLISRAAGETPTAYQNVGVMDSLGQMGSGAKKVLTGDFRDGFSDLSTGAGNLFAPSPSADQVRDYMASAGMPNVPGAYNEALKQMGAPGMLRTYGPTAAAGIGALALSGGFTPKPPEETEFQNQMRQPIDLSGDPRSYYVQNLPGVQYDEQGNIIGSFTPPVTQTMDDVRVAGKSYIGYNPMSYQPSQNQFAPYQPTFMNRGGIAALAQGGYPRRNGQINGPGTEKSDSIPAMLSDGEFVMTAKAVRGAGSGSRREGAKRMYALMNQLERNAARG
jgi:hypothetical protein